MIPSVPGAILCVRVIQQPDADDPHKLAPAPVAIPGGGMGVLVSPRQIDTFPRGNDNSGTIATRVNSKKVNNA